MNEKLKKRLVLLWRVSLVLFITYSVWPVSSGKIRSVQLVLLGILGIVPLVLWWHKAAVRWSVLFVGIAFAAILVLPSREPDPSRLRERYDQELRSYQNVRYVWGGENCLGIDCSGLVRRALIQTLWKEGVRSFNPGLLRSATSLWWNDASARALAEEYRQQTRRIQQVEALEAVIGSQLQPGDLAVTSDGRHVMAYLGEGKWIEADPDVGRVITLPTPNPDDVSNVWLKVPVTLVRWRVLTEAIR